MKVSCFIFITLSLIVATKARNNFENLDVDKILSNERFLQNYINCLLDKGPCTADEQNLRDAIPTSLANTCSECTEKEKMLIKKSVKYIMKNNPKEFQLIQQHYDPTGKYKENIEKFIKA